MFIAYLLGLHNYQFVWLIYARCVVTVSRANGIAKNQTTDRDQTHVNS